MIRKPRLLDDSEHIQDEDGGTDSDWDVCERCGLIRAEHNTLQGDGSKDDQDHAFE